MVRVSQAALAFLCLAGPLRAQSHDDVHASPACTHCGMDREKFAQSRMLVEYEDGTKVGLCSIHCAGVELAVAIDRTPKAIRVGDRATKALIDAEKAVWVIGGDVAGVMTKRAKWAFADRATAEEFVKVHGGTIATFDDAMSATYQDMYQDTKAIRERRAKRKAAKAASMPSKTTPTPASH
jgi:hypothetical protein